MTDLLAPRPRPTYLEDAEPGRSLGPAFDLVAMVGSMGGPQALREVLANLPPWFPAAILVVQHRTPAAQDLTVELLRRRTRLPVELARSGGRPCAGVVQVMPADQRLQFGSDGCFLVGPPAAHGRGADPLFVSVAQRFGARAIGVVVSGANDDGAAGVAAIKQAGGRVLVQDRASARCFVMPAAAIATGCADLVLPTSGLAPALVSLVMWPGAAELFRVPRSPWAN